MKLLSIEEQKAKKKTDDVLQKIRNQEIQEEAVELRTQLNDANDEFEKKLTDHQKIWAEEKEKHAEWRNKAQVEVSELEIRRQNALLPVQTEWDKLNNEKQRFEVEKTQFVTEKEQFEDDKIVLQTRLDQVADRELQVSIQEDALSVRRKGVEQQAKSIATQSKELSIRLITFDKKAKDTTTRLTTWEQILASKEDGQKIEASRLQAWEVDLNKRERLLQSNYAALAAAKKEIYG